MSIHLLQKITGFLFVSLVLVLSGCTRDTSRPPDLPKLNPCQIVVIQNQQPLENALVRLQSTDPNTKYGSSSGTTDSMGVASLSTYGYKGAPEGEYSITVRKTVTEGGKEIENPFGGKSRRGGKDYSLVEKQYVNMKTTPLKITISAEKSKKNEMVVDIGRKVHDFIGIAPE